MMWNMFAKTEVFLNTDLNVSLITNANGEPTLTYVTPDNLTYCSFEYVQFV